MGRTGRGIERVVYAGDSRADGALVNPYGHEEIVATIRRILEDDALDQWLRVNDVRRAALLSCTRSAPQTASVYGQAYHEGQARPGKDIAVRIWGTASD